MLSLDIKYIKLRDIVSLKEANPNNDAGYTLRMKTDVKQVRSRRGPILLSTVPVFLGKCFVSS